MGGRLRKRVVAVQTPVNGGVGSSWWYLVVQRTSGKPSGGANVREAGRIRRYDDE